MKIRNLLSIPILALGISSQAFGLGQEIREQVCFEDRRAGVASVLDFDTNDVCLECIAAFDEDAGVTSDITVLCTAVAGGGIDNVDVIINPDLAHPDVDFSIHANGANYLANAGDTFMSKSELFPGQGDYCNVAASGNCDGSTKAFTISGSHGLDSTNSIADMIALKNISQGGDIINGTMRGSYVQVGPHGLPVITEGNSYPEEMGFPDECNPAVSDLSQCQDGDAAMSTLQTTMQAHMSNNFASISNKVNHGKSAREYAINPVDPSFDTGAPSPQANFSGARLTFANASNITEYIYEARDNWSVADNGNAFQWVLRRRNICDLIECTGVPFDPNAGGGPGPGPGPDPAGNCSDGIQNGDETGIDTGGRCGSVPAEYVCAPGNAPCDYSFCSCYLTSDACGRGDADGDNVCWWDSSESRCRGANDITDELTCTGGTYDFGWDCLSGSCDDPAYTDQVSCQGALKTWTCSSGQCAGNSYKNQPPNSCTFHAKTIMGNSDDGTLSTYSRASVFYAGGDSFTVEAIVNGTLGGDSVEFAGPLSVSMESMWHNSLPRNSNCFNDGFGNTSCEVGLYCDSSTNSCKPSP